MTSCGFRALIALVPVFGFAGAAGAAPITEQLKNACAVDYRKFCNEFGLETAALKLCMDRNGQKLSKTCVNALVQDGQVSQAEVDRRKKSGK
jgi:hypothetical protein